MLVAMTTPGDEKDHGRGGGDEEVEEVDVAMRTPGDENGHGGFYFGPEVTLVGNNGLIYFSVQPLIKKGRKWIWKILFWAGGHIGGAIMGNGGHLNGLI